MLGSHLMTVAMIELENEVEFKKAEERKGYFRPFLSEITELLKQTDTDAHFKSGLSSYVNHFY